MAIEIIVPTLGESVSDATVARWIKTKGDNVAADEPAVSYTHLRAHETGA